MIELRFTLPPEGRPAATSAIVYLEELNTQAVDRIERVVKKDRRHA
jgi:hypothetical protein